ncbi:MAG: RNA methyltransferase [Odoribacter sp.]|nr:RNA methyltransferase [Odoribacter sp.]
MKSEKEQIEHLKNFVTDERRILLNRLILERTDYVTIVLEDLYQSHNQSAVMRTAECMGVQNIHIIENRNEYDVSSSVSRRAREWLTLHRYNNKDNNTPETIKHLREQGYRIIATTPHTEDVELDKLDIEKGKMAFFFGTELTSLSTDVLEEADEFVKIPMYGFTESMNVSVCAALILYNVIQRLRKSEINWKLSEEEQIKVALNWYKKSVKASEEILERFNSDI